MCLGTKGGFGEGIELSLGTRVGAVHGEWPGLATKVGRAVATENGLDLGGNGEPQKG